MYKTGDKVIYKYPQHDKIFSNNFTIDKCYTVLIGNNHYGKIRVETDQGNPWWINMNCFETFKNTEKKVSVIYSKTELDEMKMRRDEAFDTYITLSKIINSNSSKE